MTASASLNTAKRIRRSPADLRAQALAAARRLIMAGEEPVLTMRAVADAIGVTYPNLSHHFGSAAGLHAAVAEQMVGELLLGLRDIANQLEDGPDSRRLVDKMFNLFDRDGLGRVITWLVQSGEGARLEPIRLLLADYMAESRHGPAEDSHAAEVALIVSLAAYGEASAGPLIGDLLGFTGEARRALLARMVEPLIRHKPY
jgi:AcrR family transcriptional regulator